MGLLPVPCSTLGTSLCSVPAMNGIWLKSHDCVSKPFKIYTWKRFLILLTDRKGITEEVIEKPKSDTIYDGDDDDDDNVDKEINDDEDYDADVGYVNDDTDDDEFK